MGYLFSVAAGLIGGIAAVLLIERRRSNKRRRARSRAANAAGDEKGTAGKIEFSKLFLSAVLLTYFAGFALGVWVKKIKGDIFWGCITPSYSMGDCCARMPVKALIQVGTANWTLGLESAAVLAGTVSPRTAKNFFHFS